MRHQAHVLPVVGANLFQAIGELLTLAPELFKAAEATGHGVPPGVDHLCVGQDQLDQTNMKKVVRHFVDEERRVPAVNLRVVQKLFPKLAEQVGIKVHQNFRIARFLIVWQISPT